MALTKDTAYMLRCGVQWKEIAALYGIAVITVWRISSKRNWGFLCE